MDQTLHRMATKEREEIKRMTTQKMARRHNKERGNHLDQESIRQTTIEGSDGGLHPAVDGQSLDERRRNSDAALWQTRAKQQTNKYKRKKQWVEAAVNVSQCAETVV